MLITAKTPSENEISRFCNHFSIFPGRLASKNCIVNILHLNWCERFGDKKKKFKICRYVRVSSTHLIKE